jgi:hypothetical protein
VKVSGAISQIGVAGSIVRLNIASSITQKGVTGSIGESGITHVPPVYVSNEIGILDSNTIYIQYDIPLDVFLSTPIISDFTVTLSGGAVSIVGITMYGDTNKIGIVLNRGMTAGETGTIAYTPGDTPIRASDDYSAIAAAFSVNISSYVT